MATKTCPSCGADVPVAARRCKECFHDFDEVAAPRSGGPMALLAAVAAMAVLGAATFWYVSSIPTDLRILVDEGSRSVQWVTQYQDGTLQTDRLAFDDIGKLEYVVTRGGDFEIRAVTLEGERKVIETDPNKPLQLRAEKYAEMMNKPLDLVDQSLGAR
jgi:hypothetical protein